MSETSSSPSGADGDTPFELQYFPPDADLAEMVSSFYFVRIDMPLFDEVERADRPQFRIMSLAEGEYIFADGHCFPAGRATISGPGRDRQGCEGNHSVAVAAHACCSTPG